MNTHENIVNCTLHWVEGGKALRDAPCTINLESGEFSSDEILWCFSAEKKTDIALEFANGERFLCASNKVLSFSQKDLFEIANRTGNTDSRKNMSMVTIDANVEINLSHLPLEKRNEFAILVGDRLKAAIKREVELLAEETQIESATVEATFEATFEIDVSITTDSLMNPGQFAVESMMVSAAEPGAAIMQSTDPSETFSG